MSGTRCLRRRERSLHARTPGASAEAPFAVPLSHRRPSDPCGCGQVEQCWLSSKHCSWRGTWWHMTSQSRAHQCREPGLMHLETTAAPVLRPPPSNHQRGQDSPPLYLCAILSLRRPIKSLVYGCVAHQVCSSAVPMRLGYELACAHNTMQTNPESAWSIAYRACLSIARNGVTPAIEAQLSHIRHVGYATCPHI